MFRSTCIGITALLTISSPLVASATDTGGAAPQRPPFQAVTHANGTIVDVAVGNPDFSTLVTALESADLVETLQGPGPFTVFAPTNDAFAKLPAALLDFLLANPDQLSAVLQYHVAQGSNDLRYQYAPREYLTVQGQNVYADRELDDLRINNSSVIASVIQTDNGVIYVIDSVLIPQYQ